MQNWLIGNETCCKEIYYCHSMCNCPGRAGKGGSGSFLDIVFNYKQQEIFFLRFPASKDWGWQLEGLKDSDEIPSWAFKGERYHRK